MIKKLFFAGTHPSYFVDQRYLQGNNGEMEIIDLVDDDEAPLLSVLLNKQNVEKQQSKPWTPPPPPQRKLAETTKTLLKDSVSVNIMFNSLPNKLAVSPW